MSYVYNGDVNLEHGGAFINLSTWEHGYCSAVRVSSGFGFDGACLIEHVVILGVDDAKKIRDAVKSCSGGFWKRNGESPAEHKQNLRHMIADSLLNYGCYDPDDTCTVVERWSETVQTEPDGPMEFDGWKAAKRLHNTTLEDYVRSVHLKG